jgi:hypothetical protein
MEVFAELTPLEVELFGRHLGEERSALEVTEELVFAPTKTQAADPLFRLRDEDRTEGRVDPGPISPRGLEGFHQRLVSLLVVGIGRYWQLGNSVHGHHSFDLKPSRTFFIA